MTSNFKKSSVVAASKSNRYSFILRVISATLVDWALLAEQWKQVTGAKFTAEIPLLGGAKLDESVHTIECLAGSVVPVINPGESPMDGKAEIDAVVEGVDENTLAWAYTMQGEECVVIAERCSDSKQFIFANPCTGGMIFQYQSIGSQDGGRAGVAFKFTGTDCPRPMLVYAPTEAETVE